MKFLLVAINAKYIHNTIICASYSPEKAYAEKGTRGKRKKQQRWWYWRQCVSGVAEAGVQGAEVGGVRMSGRDGKRRV